MNNSNPISRRSFLKGTAAVSALTALQFAGLALYASAETEKELEKKWVNEAPESIDKIIETDVVIIGCGMSGTCCALKASENGLNVTIIDKLSFTGGATNYNVDTIFAMGDAEHKRLGTETNITPAEFVKTELEHGQYRNDGSCWWNVIDDSPEYVEWFKSYGLEFVATDTGGLELPFFKMFPLMFAPGEGGGKVATDTLIKAAKDKGTQVLLNTEALSLIQTDDGTVTGLYAKSKTDGYLQINAKAVVLATGGFGSNPELWRKAGFNADNMVRCGTTTNLGDGYNMALAAGGMDGIFDSAPLGQNLIPAFPGRVWNDPINGNFGFPLMAKRIEVNQDAKRFMNEDWTLNIDPLGHPLSTMNNKASFVIFDQVIFDEQFAMYGDFAQQQLEGALADESGTFFKCDSIADCADKMGLDAETLEKTINEYNSMCDAGDDKRFGKLPIFLQKLQAPYYIGKYQIGITVFAGGIHANADMQVVNINREPIAGLYSIGVDSNPMYRNFYTFSGCAMGYNAYSGRKAADVLAKRIKG